MGYRSKVVVTATFALNHICSFIPLSGLHPSQQDAVGCTLRSSCSMVERPCSAEMSGALPVVRRWRDLGFVLSMKQWLVPTDPLLSCIFLLQVLKVCLPSPVRFVLQIET